MLDRAFVTTGFDLELLAIFAIQPLNDFIECGIVAVVIRIPWKKSSLLLIAEQGIEESIAAALEKHFIDTETIGDSDLIDPEAGQMIYKAWTLS